MSNLPVYISPSLADRVQNARAQYDKAMSPEGTGMDIATFAGQARTLIDEMAQIIEWLTRPEIDRLERELSSAYAGKHETRG